jgi:hypothetical protein
MDIHYIVMLPYPARERPDDDFQRKLARGK